MQSRLNTCSDNMCSISLNYLEVEEYFLKDRRQMNWALHNHLTFWKQE